MHDDAAKRTISRPTEMSQGRRILLSPAVYDLPRPTTNENIATYYRKRVEYVDHEFYLDGVPLHRIARPPKPRALPESTPEIEGEEEVEWLN